MIAPLRPESRRRRPFRTMRERRERMIRETSAFLTWAMRMERQGNPLPRIPRLRVDQGGFSGMLMTAGGRSLIRQWWKINVWDKRWRFD